MKENRKMTKQWWKMKENDEKWGKLSKYLKISKFWLQMKKTKNEKNEKERNMKKFGFTRNILDDFQGLPLLFSFGRETKTHILRTKINEKQITNHSTTTTTIIQSGEASFLIGEKFSPNFGELNHALPPSRGPNPIPAIPPYVVRTPHLHGAPTTEETNWTLILMPAICVCYAVVMQRQVPGFLRTVHRCSSRTSCLCPTWRRNP